MMRFIRDVSGIDDSPIVNRGCDDASMISTRNCFLARMAPIWVPDGLALRTGRSRLAYRAVDERLPPSKLSVGRPVRGKHIGQVRFFELSISLVVRLRAPQEMIQHEEGHFYGTGAKVALGPDSNRFVVGAELIVEDLRRDEAVRVDDRFDHFLQIGC